MFNMFKKLCFNSNPTIKKASLAEMAVLQAEMFFA